MQFYYAVVQTDASNRALRNVFFAVSTTTQVSHYSAIERVLFYYDSGNFIVLLQF